MSLFDQISLVSIGDLIDRNGLAGFIGLGIVSLVSFISLIGHIGFVGRISHNGLIGIIGLSLVSLIGIVGLIGFGLVSLIGLDDLKFISVFGSSASLAHHLIIFFHPRRLINSSVVQASSTRSCYQANKHYRNCQRGLNLLCYRHSLMREKMWWWLALMRKKMWWWITSFGES
jgi:hypothetical protein